MQPRQMVVFVALCLAAVLVVMTAVSAFRHSHDEVKVETTTPPAVHVETEKPDGGVAVDAPGVHVEKDKDGTHVEAPGVKIDVPPKQPQN